MEIILATHNIHKVRELRVLFKNLKRTIELLSLHQFPHYIQPQESSESFKENAMIKARHASLSLNKWVLADDSGLVIPRLQGSSKAHSKRYDGNQATDKENRKQLLQKMQKFTNDERYVFFECNLALCSPNGYEKISKGICEGYLLTEERGGNGYGYDPLFIKHDYDKSFGELDEGTKNRISHRYRAFEKLIPSLETLVA